ncbi:MAG: metal-dependent hydrolase [Candidatus Nanohalobium sp.]
MFSWFFLGVAVGSLVPDADVSGSLIFHRKVRGVEGGFGRFVNDFVAPLFPVFGYVTRYLIYLPAVMLFDRVSSYSFGDWHRSFSHSLLGLFTMSSVTGLYIWVLSSYLGFYSFQLLFLFLSGYLLGGFLHLFEDSCTRTGIAWNSPFSDFKLCGDLKTSGKPVYVRGPRRLFYAFVVVAAVSFIGSSLELYGVSARGYSFAAFLVDIGIWTVFAYLVDLRLETPG